MGDYSFVIMVGVFVVLMAAFRYNHYKEKAFRKEQEKQERKEARRKARSGKR